MSPVRLRMIVTDVIYLDPAECTPRLKKCWPANFLVSLITNLDAVESFYLPSITGHFGLPSIFNRLVWQSIEGDVLSMTWSLCRNRPRLWLLHQFNTGMTSCLLTWNRSSPITRKLYDELTIFNLAISVHGLSKLITKSLHNKNVQDQWEASLNEGRSIMLPLFIVGSKNAGGGMKTILTLFFLRHQKQFFVK